ncbi:MAG: Fe(2+)-trafficking protein [Phycisphaerales bacterium]
MDIAQRIAQFENMVREEADPTNDMAWFSLARAYSEAGRPADAAKAYTRCFELNPAMTKAYQLAGEALVAAGDKDRAIAVLTEGFKVAVDRGDFMPKKAMAEALSKLGAPVPEVAAKQIELPPGTFLCSRTGKPGHRLPRPPFKNAVGQWIYDNISKETFDEWIRQGTKVINELRLDLSREQDAETYDKHMRDYLGIDDELLASLAPKQ